MFHRTPRLFLRPPFPEDRDALLGAIGTSMTAGATLLKPGYGSTLKPFARQFVVLLPEGEGAPLIGMASLLERGGALEVRLVIAPAFRSRGYGSEVLAGLLEIARVLGFRRITAVHCSDDPAADRMLEKAGFSATGKFVDNDDYCDGAPAVLYQLAAMVSQSPGMTSRAAA